MFIKIQLYSMVIDNSIFYLLNAGCQTWNKNKYCNRKIQIFFYYYYGEH